MTNDIDIHHPASDNRNLWSATLVATHRLRANACIRECPIPNGSRRFVWQDEFVGMTEHNLQADMALRGLRRKSNVY